jgi:hypothetical protein
MFSLISKFIVDFKNKYESNLIDIILEKFKK